MFDFSSSPLLTLRTPGERTFRLFALLLIHWGIAFIVPVVVGVIPGTIASLILGLNGFMKLFGDAMSQGLSGGSGTLDSEAIRALSESISATKGYRIAELFGSAWSIAVAIFFCLAIQRRSLATIGLEKRDAAKRYGIGFLFGAVLCSLVILLSCLSRASTFVGFNSDVDVLFLFFILIGYVIQGAAEELLIHGLFMTALFRNVRWLPAVLISALLFSVLHAANAGVTVLSILNVFLFGVFLGLYVIRTGSVVGATAIHAAWNFAEGQIFGCPVSGFASFSGLFTVTSDASRSVTNGGAFGPEGGLAATMVLMLALIAVIFLPPFRKKDQPEP